MEHQIAFRVARNTLLDTLNIGIALPIRDLKISALKEKVAFNTVGKLLIERTEKEVTYQPFLVSMENELLVYEQFGQQAKCEENNTELVLTTGNIKYDSWFAVRASKKMPGNELFNVFLHDFVPIRVGIDVSLNFRFKEANVFDYGIQAVLVIEKAEEGVQ